MRTLSTGETSAVAGGGTGQEIAQCIATSAIESGWVGIAMTIGGMFTGGALTNAYFGGLLVGCTLVHIQSC